MQNSSHLVNLGQKALPVTRGEQLSIFIKDTASMLLLE